MAVFRELKRLSVTRQNQRIAFQFKLPEGMKRVVSFDLNTTDTNITTGRLVLSTHRQPVLYATDMRVKDFDRWVPFVVEPDEGVDWSINGPQNGTRHHAREIGATVEDTTLFGFYEDRINGILGADRQYDILLYLTYEM